MKRSKPLKRSIMLPGGLKRATLAGLENADRKARNLAALIVSAPKSARGVIERVTGFTPAPKSPADYNPRVRELAEGEECLIRFTPACLHPRTDTTVLCHTNKQADQKGMGYKGHDSAGVFGCAACHDVVDGRNLKWRLSAEEIDFLMGRAQRSMTIRLKQIIASPSERPWRISAARWVLDQLAARARRGQPGETT